MKAVFIVGRNIDEIWFKTLVELCKHGRQFKITSGSYAGDTRLEFDFASGIIYNPIEYTPGGERLPLAPTVPQGCPAPTSEYEIEQYFANYLMDSNLEKNEHYRYSTFIVGGNYHIPDLREVGCWININPEVIVPNQLQWCINHYKEAGFGNNHCCITVGYPESNKAYDMPFTNEAERQTSPCLRLIDTKIIEEDGVQKLCFNVVFRSWDLYNGFPTNMGGFALLMEYMAGELGVTPGSLAFTSAKLHVYGHAIQALMMRAGHSDLLEKLI